MGARQSLGGLLLAALVVASAVFVAGVHEETCPAMPASDTAAIESPIDPAAAGGLTVGDSAPVAVPTLISSTVASGVEIVGTPLETLLRVSSNGPEGP